MNRHGGPGRVVLGGVSALAIAVGITGFAGPAASAAQQLKLSLTYTCDFPVIGAQSAPIQVESNIPDSIAVGQSTAQYEVDASVSAPWELTLGLRGFGVSTITGTVDGQVDVEAPQGDLPETLAFGINKISLPAFSSFTGTATGSAPQVTFDEPGKAEIVVGNLTMRLDPRDSSGNLTSLGEMTVPCTLDSGQNDVAASFTIVGAASPASSSAGAAGSPAPTTSSASGLDPTPSTHVSASSQTTNTHPASATSASAPGSSPADASTRSTISAEPAGYASGGGTPWAAWLAGLLALAVIVAAAFRFGPRLWNRAGRR